jgi:cation:H+ antiporter
MVFIAPLILAIGLVALGLASKFAIDYSSDLSEKLGLSDFAIGFLIFAIATSLPEIIVSITSVLYGEGSIAVGNVFGSNIANLSIILGLTVILGGTIYMKKENISLMRFLFLTSLIPIIIFQTERLSIWFGLLLIGLFAYFIYLNTKGKEKKEKVKIKKKKGLPKSFLFLIISIIALVISAHFVISSSIDIIAKVMIPGSLIGATLIALATSLPELIVDIEGLHYKRYGLVLGNIIGSCIVNITLVLGIVAVISKPVINLAAFSGLYPFLLVTAMIVWYFLSVGRNITRNEGLILTAIYILFILQEVGILTLIMG